jgi:(p)ppGpp synthase/HD superfamily hydrolase
VIKVFLKGPDGKQKTVAINQNATVRDVASDSYHLFFSSIRLNGEPVPLTARAQDGDHVEVVSERF